MRIGIRREDKNCWERRTPFTPMQITHLLETHNIETTVQPSPIRIFTDRQYEQAGALIDEDLSACNAVFGVKEMPLSLFQPDTAYLFFTHTTKGQPYNMPMLSRIMESNSTLIDYERVVDDSGRRLLFFGRYAGLAGMLDTLWALGKRFEAEGLSTPFSGIQQAHRYATLNDAKAAVSEAGFLISRDGLPESCRPLICGFAGYGHVSAGAQEIYDILPHREIAPELLANFQPDSEEAKHAVYKAVFKEEHLVKNSHPEKHFNLQDYYSHPESYESSFYHYLPYLTIIVNGIYWTPDYPRLITRSQLQNLFVNEAAPRIRMIGDITCDVEGAIECTVKSTSPDAPVFIYDPVKDVFHDDIREPGIGIMAVDNLPCELPRASSKYFGQHLLPFVPSIASCDFKNPFKALELPREIKDAIVVHNGKLTGRYRYLENALTAAKGK